MNQPKNQRPNRTPASIAIALACLGLAYAPLPGLQQTIVVVSGTELQEALQQLEPRFEQANPTIKLDLKFQGSQDIVNNYLDPKNAFEPTVLIPANGVILDELRQRWQAQQDGDPFYDTPQPIVKTMLVGIAWPERGKALFPNGRFQWQPLEKAMQTGKWQTVGGQPQWGSFDFITTDPTRSNSGQLTLGLWSYSKGGALNRSILGEPEVESLFNLVKRSVYLPPRSTDVLLQEFIARGPNDADVATVYESIALYRWQQAGKSHGQSYRIYYLSPTVETVSTAAIVRRDVNQSKAKAARQFLQFLTAPEQQQVFVQYGFRPAIANIDLTTVPNSPWNQQIPGAETTPPVSTIPPPNPQLVGEIQRLWQRAN